MSAQHFDTVFSYIARRERADVGTLAHELIAARHFYGERRARGLLLSCAAELSRVIERDAVGAIDCRDDAALAQLESCVFDAVEALGAVMELLRVHGESSVPPASNAATVC